VPSVENTGTGDIFAEKFVMISAHLNRVVVHHGMKPANSKETEPVPAGLPDDVNSYDVQKIQADRPNPALYSKSNTSFTDFKLNFLPEESFCFNVVPKTL
jgi:hypothetical protein